MSLRPVDRDGGYARSRDRSRSRGPAQESGDSKNARDTRSKKSSRSAARDDAFGMPGSFDDDGDEQQARGVKFDVRSPGLSSIGLSRVGTRKDSHGGDDDNDDDDDIDDDLAFGEDSAMLSRRLGRQPSGSAKGRRPIMAMPDMPGMPSADASPQSAKSTTHATRFPPEATRGGYAARPSSFAMPYPDQSSHLPFPSAPAGYAASQVMPTMPSPPGANPLQYARLPDHHYADLTGEPLVRTATNPAVQQIRRPEAHHSVSEQALPSHIRRRNDSYGQDADPRLQRTHSGSTSHGFDANSRGVKPRDDDLDRTSSKSKRGRGLSVDDPRKDFRAPSPARGSKILEEHDDFDEESASMLARRGRGLSINDPHADVYGPSPVRRGNIHEEASENASKRGRGLSINDPRSELRAPSPGGPGTRNNRLSVSGDRPNIHVAAGGGLPPGSPMLEAYKGTYQSISPMPSPMMLPRNDDSDLDDLEPLSPSFSNDGRKELALKARKKVKLYDAEGDADRVARALRHSEPKREPLIEVLPELTHDQMLALREEYKKLVRISGKGVNLSKHINMKFSTRDKLGQACYVTSMGRWESEAYWANFWYQEHSSSRELLIESLMGRTNADIREIKANFKAKKYDDDLSRCLEKELKPDKFRTAVLMALEGRRQEETDVLPIDYRNRDVQYLHEALTSERGGETTMLKIIVTRSDAHLRDVLKTYEGMYGSNFARDALKKSTNLVGEVVAHILNGVINRPARDCLLLRHAINDLASHNQEVKNRYELLMSRLIRLHWDRIHLGRVKTEYRNKYHVDLEAHIKSATRGEFGDYCIRLCETR